MRVNEVPAEIVSLVDKDAGQAIYEATQKYGNGINIKVPNIDYSGTVNYENDTPTAGIFADIFFRFDSDRDHISEFYIEVYYEMDEAGAIYSSDTQEDIVYKVMSEIESRMREADNRRSTGRYGYRRN